MVLVLSIKDGFYKIEKSIFRSNNARYEKMLRSKIIHLKETYILAREARDENVRAKRADF